MQSGNKNLPGEKSEKIPENETPVTVEEIPKETYNKYGDSARNGYFGAIG